MQRVREHQLLEMATRGNELAIEQLLCRYWNRLCRMISSLLHPRLSARIEPEDIVQEALLSAANRLPIYLKNRPVAFFPWLRSLAIDQLIHVQRQHLQSQRRSVHREQSYLGHRTSSALQNWEQLVADRESPPSQHAIAQEQREHVRKTINQLQGHEREILMMRYARQMSIVDIADELSVSPTAAKSRLRRAQQSAARWLRSVA